MIAALARLLPYVVRVQRSLVLGLACILAATAPSLTAPWLLEYVIDGLLEGADRSRLALYAAALVGLTLADGAFRYLTRSLVIGASLQIEYDLKPDFFVHLPSSSSRRLQDRKVDNPARLNPGAGLQA
jgi:ATP-binding cassette subfamily B protein